MTDVSLKAQSIVKPELKLEQHPVDGRIVNVNLVVSLRNRRNLTLVKCPGPPLVYQDSEDLSATIGLLKKPLSICYSG